MKWATHLPTLVQGLNEPSPIGSTHIDIKEDVAILDVIMDDYGVAHGMLVLEAMSDV